MVIVISLGAPLLALFEKGPAEPPTSPPAHPRPPRSTSLYRPGSQTLLSCTLQTRGLRPLPALAFLPTPRNRKQQRIRAIVREISFEFVAPNQAFPVEVLSHRDSVLDTHGGIDLLRRRRRNNCVRLPSFRFVLIVSLAAGRPRSHAQRRLRRLVRFHHHLRRIGFFRLHQLQVEGAPSLCLRRPQTQGGDFDLDGGGGMADAPAFDLLSPPMKRCAPSFAHFAKRGNHERMGNGVCPTRVASATLPPILTKNAKMPVWGSTRVNACFRQSLRPTFRVRQKKAAQTSGDSICATDRKRVVRSSSKLLHHLIQYGRCALGIATVPQVLRRDRMRAYS